MAVEIGNWNRGGASPRLTLVCLASLPSSAENFGEEGPLCWETPHGSWVFGLLKAGSPGQAKPWECTSRTLPIFI